MKKILALLLVVMLATVGFVACGSSEGSEGDAESSQTLTLGGSTSVEAVIQAMMQMYTEETGIELTYAPTGSSTGIKGALDGSLDIGLSSRGLKDDEKTTLTETVFALDAIAIVVNPANPVSDLDIETIGKLAKGEITNWSEVGGADVPVVFIGRDAASGTRDGFESVVGVKEECIYAEEQASTGAVIAGVSSNEGAIGYVSLASASDKVNVLTVGGITPDEVTVQDGTYELQRPFVFATPTGATSEQVDAFITWATSEATVELITNSGAIALK